MAQSWLKQETSSSHPERAGGRAAQAQAHEQVHSNVLSTNMNQAATVPSSALRSQTEAGAGATGTVTTPNVQVQAQAQAYTQAQLPTSASMTPVFPITDLTTTHPPSSFHPTAAASNFNTIDIPYAESTYSSSNVSAASTSTPATPVTGVGAGAAEGSVATRSPSISATTSSAENPTAPAPASSDSTALAAASKVKAKRVRTSKPKVKTGCTNCKFVSPILVPSPPLA